MAMTKKEVTIELPSLKVEMMDLTVIGDTPLIVHAWSAKARRQMLSKHMKLAKEQREAKDPVKDYEESMYRLDDGGYGFPSIGFKAAAVTAVTSISGLAKTEARQAFHVVGEGVDMSGAFNGVRMRQNLVRIGGEPHMREDPVKIGMTTDLRYRAEFWPWSAAVLVRYNASLLSASQILQLFNFAGFGCGIGEWRPEKDGENGMFHVAAEGERAVAASKRRKPVR